MLQEIEKILRCQGLESYTTSNDTLVEQLFLEKLGEISRIVGHKNLHDSTVSNDERTFTYRSFGYINLSANELVGGSTTSAVTQEVIQHAADSISISSGDDRLELVRITNKNITVYTVYFNRQDFLFDLLLRYAGYN